MHGQPKRRKCGVSSVFRRKTLAQGRFTRPGHVKSNGPQKITDFWGNWPAKEPKPIVKNPTVVHFVD